MQSLNPCIKKTLFVENSCGPNSDQNYADRDQMSGRALVQHVGFWGWSSPKECGRTANLPAMAGSCRQSLVQRMNAVIISPCVADIGPNTCITERFCPLNDKLQATLPA